MLTKDLLRFKIDGDQVKPMWLRTTPAVVRAAEAVLGVYRDHIGATRQELDEELQRVAAAARSSVMVRGLTKIVADRSRFDDPADCAQLRWQVLTTAAQRLVAGAVGDPLAHRQAVAAELSIDDDIDELLYADLPHLARLREVPEWSAETLIGEYNLGLAQGLILKTAGLEVELPGDAVAMHRRVLAGLRFQRLLAEVSRSSQSLRLRVTGPGSVIDQGRRYGLQLASFLPTVSGCPQWRVRADIEERGQRASFTLDHSLGLPGRQQSTAWVPDELQDLCARVAKKNPEWQVSDQPDFLVLPNGELVVPDVSITTESGRVVAIECFHRWHHSAFQRRWQQLREQPDLPLIIGVDRALGKRQAVAPIVQNATFAERGFLFSSYPSPTAVRKSVLTFLAD